MWSAWRGESEQAQNEQKSRNSCAITRLQHGTHQERRDDDEGEGKNRTTSQLLPLATAAAARAKRVHNKNTQSHLLSGNGKHIVSIIIGMCILNVCLCVCADLVRAATACCHCCHCTYVCYIVLIIEFILDEKKNKIKNKEMPYVFVCAQAHIRTQAHTVVSTFI